MYTYSGSTMTELHERMCMGLALAPRERLDTISVVDVSQHNVMAEADSMVWDFDIKTLWLTKSRWSMMVRQYLDRDDVLSWVNRCATMIGGRGRGTAVLRTKTVKPRGGAATGHTNKESRRWGSCMLSVSYKAIPHPTITLHSRTSYLGYLSVLDLSIAWMLGRQLADKMGVDVEKFRFVWMVESVQWHAFKSIPFLLCNDNEDIRRLGRRLLLKKLADLTEDESEFATAPAIKISRVWLNKVRREDQWGLTYGDMTYNTYRRVRRRWHTEVLGHDKAVQFEGWSHYKEGHPRAGEQKEFYKAYGILPHCEISRLDLSPIGILRGDDRSYTESPVVDEPAEACLECGDFDE